MAKDGQGLMFWSNLGIHFEDVELVEKAPRCKCCGQTVSKKPFNDLELLLKKAINWEKKDVTSPN